MPATSVPTSSTATTSTARLTARCGADSGRALHPAVDGGLTPSTVVGPGQLFERSCVTAAKQALASRCATAWLHPQRARCGPRLRCLSADPCRRVTRIRGVRPQPSSAARRTSATADQPIWSTVCSLGCSTSTESSTRCAWAGSWAIPCGVPRAFLTQAEDGRMLSLHTPGALRTSTGLRASPRAGRSRSLDRTGRPPTRPAA
jgi:hypothetical protein